MKGKSVIFCWFSLCLIPSPLICEEPIFGMGCCIFLIHNEDGVYSGSCELLVMTKVDLSIMLDGL